MDLTTYQARAAQTAIYPRQDALPTYPALKLNGEAGEVAEQIGKAIRDDQGAITPDRFEHLMSEMGDVLWYLANLANDLNVDLSAVAQENLDKLSDRMERGVIGGSGSNR
mgnify:CR=1 FL=1